MHAMVTAPMFANAVSNAYPVNVCFSFPFLINARPCQQTQSFILLIVTLAPASFVVVAAHTPFAERGNQIMLRNGPSKKKEKKRKPRERRRCHLASCSGRGGKRVESSGSLPPPVRRACISSRGAYAHLPIVRVRNAAEPIRGNRNAKPGNRTKGLGHHYKRTAANFLKTSSEKKEIIEKRGANSE